MTLGPGKYDDEVTVVRNLTQAAGVVLIVIGGAKGEGFAIQATLEVTLALPQMLRTIADQLDADQLAVDLESYQNKRRGLR
jgi:hypothetical protein